MNSAVSILMYHQVGPFSKVKTHRSTYCHHRRFAAQMRFLSLMGYTVMGLDDVFKSWKEVTPIKRRSVVLTFDDGYRNFYDYAFPELKKYGFPATVYLISNLIDHSALWLKEEGREAPEMLTRDQIAQLQRSGVTFGSHGVHHRKLAKIESDEMKFEVHQGKVDLEKLLGQAVEHFCYPYGNYSLEVIRTVQEAGFSSAVTCLRAAANPRFDPRELPRKAISYGDSLLGFWWKLMFKNRPKRQPLSPFF